MAQDSNLARVRREIMLKSVAYGVFVAILLGVSGAAMGLAAELHPARFAGTAVDLVRHTQNTGFHVMTALAVAGLAAGLCIVVAGALIAFTQRR